MTENKGLLGALSAIATFGLLALIAWKTHVFGIVLHDLALFFTGHAHSIDQTHGIVLVAMIPTIIAVIVLNLPSTLGAAFLEETILGRSGTHSVAEMLKSMKDGNHFFTFFVFCAAEELFARWLFLGLLAKIAFLSGTAAFYLLFLTGNGIWALWHLSNFKKKSDRKILRVLPQFVSGVFYTYVFVKYGLLASILAHFGTNAVFFSLHKVQRVNGVDVMIIGYSALCALVSYVLMDKPLTDTLQWFADKPAFRLQGWGYWDYVKISIFVPGCINAIFGLLIYDRGDAGKKSTVAKHIILYAVAIPLVIMLSYAAYWALGFAIPSVPYRVLILAIIISFMHSGASGSALARVFWGYLPDTYIMVCLLQALGFWPAVGWIAIKTTVNTPKRLLTAIDD